ncbi:NAD(P)-dependent oxidoreductase [Fodinicola feengrottensis]|uniref:NAD(P)-dependent oxidoreductase n=1 Tax=Fodinicola feengrottensis TaxID=435914 RepID=UPI0013D7DCFC|nr:NAD(P)-dependent oxidoreductase [Fodinicola feengrottensis]
MKNAEVIVVGAGVIGLTTGIRLLEAGADVRILAAELNRRHYLGGRDWDGWAGFPRA